MQFFLIWILFHFLYCYFRSKKIEICRYKNTICRYISKEYKVQLRLKSRGWIQRFVFIFLKNYAVLPFKIKILTLTTSFMSVRKSHFQNNSSQVITGLKKVAKIKPSLKNMSLNSCSGSYAFLRRSPLICTAKNSISLGVKPGASSKVKNSVWAHPPKLRVASQSDSRKMKILKRYMHLSVHCSTTYNSRDREAT